MVLAIVIGISLRLIPTTVSGKPFSTDIWPLITLSQTLYSNPWHRIWDDSVFKGHHNKWPAVIFEGAIYTSVTGLDVEFFFRYVGVLITQLIVMLSFFSFVKRRLGVAPALMSLYALTSLPSLIVFTSATLKEVYSYPFAALLLLILFSRGYKLRKYFLLTLTAIALVASHPLTPLIVIAFIASYIFAIFVDYVKGGFRALELSGVRSLSASLILVTAIYILYMALYGSRGLIYRFSLGDYAKLGIIAISIYGWYFLVGKDAIYFLPFMALGVTGLFISMSHRLINSTLAMYIAPAVIMLAPAIRRMWCRDIYIILSSISLPILVSMLYIATTPVLMSILHRVLNCALVTAVAAVVYFAWRGGMLRIYAVVATLIGVALSIATAINIAVGMDPLVYYWRYSEGEVQGILTIARYMDYKGICGDSKIFYFVGHSIEVDIVCGLELFQSSRIERPMVLYIDNLRYGYVLSPIDIYPIYNFSKVLEKVSLVYNSDVVYALN